MRAAALVLDGPALLVWSASQAEYAAAAFPPPLPPPPHAGPSSGHAADDAFLLRVLAALRQWHVVPGDAARLGELLATLRSTERFYDVIGGVVGYQLTALRLMAESEGAAESGGGGGKRALHAPVGTDLVAHPGLALRLAARGLRRLAEVGEVYPLGGAGDRLGLTHPPTGEPLPAAVLPFAGRPLLASLLRDADAREWLHLRVFGAAVRAPVALMTSAAASNHDAVAALCEAHAWFGRGAENFRLFAQPLVPVVAAATGAWLLAAPGALATKPGGHGCVWKLAADGGVLGWMEGRGCSALLVRQITNPAAGADTTLLALAGAGFAPADEARPAAEDAAAWARGAAARGPRAADPPPRRFGFASCARAGGAAEGVNALVEARAATGAWRYHVGCVEYTQFGGAAAPPGAPLAPLPANTNVLFVSLAGVRAGLAAGPAGCLPGLLVNTSKPVAAWAPAPGGGGPGVTRPVRAGRLECSMQGLADVLADVSPARVGRDRWGALSTFVVFALRRAVTSSAKRRRASAADRQLAQTPDGAFLDALRNAADVLRLGGVAHPPVGDDGEYAHACPVVPPFLFCFHPALGPPWHVAAQKVVRGSLAPGAELVLELAEADVTDLRLDGSLRVVADSPVGWLDADARQVRLCADRCGRARLARCTVRNAGVAWDDPGNVAWAGQLARAEGVLVTLAGGAEFDAEGVTLCGPHHFHVPDGHRMTLRPAPLCAGDAHPDGFTVALQRMTPGAPPSWAWHYSLGDDGRITLQRRHAESPCDSRQQDVLIASGVTI